MASRNSTAILVFFVMVAFCGACSGAVYRVGDSDGWTSRGPVDYNKWVSTKEFHVGDALMFAYNNQFHNVLQVTDQDFESCNGTSAIKAYTSGSDIITLKRPGHYFFLCGTPGHCQAGQKVAMKVTLPIPDYLLASPIHSPSASHSEEVSPSSTASKFPTLGWAVTTLVLCLLGFVF